VFHYPVQKNPRGEITGNLQGTTDFGDRTDGAIFDFLDVSSGMGKPNPKSEPRNPKQIRNPKGRNKPGGHRKETS